MNTVWIMIILLHKFLLHYIISFTSTHPCKISNLIKSSSKPYLIKIEKQYKNPYFYTLSTSNQQSIHHWGYTHPSLWVSTEIKSFLKDKDSWTYWLICQWRDSRPLRTSRWWVIVYGMHRRKHLHSRQSRNCWYKSSKRRRTVCCFCLTNPIILLFRNQQQNYPSIKQVVRPCQWSPTWPTRRSNYLQA